MGLTLLAQAQFPVDFWLEAFQTACYLINRLPTPVLSNKSHFQTLFGKKPYYNNLHPFGCTAYLCLTLYNHNKLQYHSTKCVFIGYSLSHKGFKCLSPQGRVYISRHVIFDDIEFSYKSIFNSVLQHEQQATSAVQIISNSITLPSSAGTTTDISTFSYEEVPTSVSSSPSRSVPFQNFSPASISDFSAHSNFTSPNSASPNSTSSNSTRYCPNPNLDPITSCERPIQTLPRAISTHAMQTRSKRGITKPKRLCIPCSVKQALQDPIWKKAMQEEFSALQKNNTWSLVPYSPSMSTVGSKWIFKIKHNSDGSIQRYKARLVAQGFTQTPCVDYFETFSPFIKPATTRIILTLTASLQWPVHQLDFNNAFLNGILQEKVYMSQPTGFVDPNFLSHVCQLNKALYGLKQAPRAWFDKLRLTLLSWGFQHSKADSSLFFFKTSDKTL